ncbi:MAG: phosphate ABC transporter permease PstA [Oculatellaceae cyanobacterium Prado106]|nr:phosphate ABC transporter permease PstA [Oculatellaceae cyanobacterium Prado106]
MASVVDQPPSDSSSSMSYTVAPMRKAFGAFMTVLATGCALLLALPLFSILWTVISRGMSGLSLAVFTELPPPPLMQGGGFGNAILGSLTVLAIAALISVPFGIMAAIFVSEFARGTKFANFVRFGINVLSGVPSIIMGLFAYAVVVLTTGTFSALAGGVALAILMIPIVERTAEEGLKSVPMETRQGAIGVGATNFQTISQIVLPAALPSIATGVTLSLARAAGETAPLLITALFNNFYAQGILQPIATLPVLIYNFAGAPYKNQQDLAWVASLLIVTLILIVSIVARSFARRQHFG